MKPDLQKTGKSILPGNYTSASVIIDEALEIVYFHGRTEDYLDYAPGKASHNLFKMAKQSLTLELHKLLDKAQEASCQAIIENIPVRIKDVEHIISIEAIPLSNMAKPHYLVLFHDYNASIQSKAEKVVISIVKKDEKDLRIAQLEKALAQSQEALKRKTASKESDMMALYTLNESLTTLNEELETSTEELISTGEELTVTNQELHQVNRQVKRISDKVGELLVKFQTLVKQAPVAICIYEGKDYIVEIANDFYLQMVGKDQGFIGKPLFESLPQMQAEGIKEMLDHVFDSGTPFYGNEVELNFLKSTKGVQGFFNFVCQPIFVNDNVISSIMIVAQDVTDLVLARKIMEVQAIMVNDLLMNAPAFITTLIGPDHVYGLVNEKYQQLFGNRKIQGKPMLEALPELKGQGFDVLLDKVYSTGTVYIGTEMPTMISKDENAAPELRYFNFNYQPMYDADKKIYAILCFGYEVTEQVIARNKNEESHEMRARELEEKVQTRTLELRTVNEDLRNLNKELESFTYISSHDLQEPLRKIQTFTKLIIEREEDVLSDTGKDYFRRIQDAAMRMQQLIKDLLAFSLVNTIGNTFEKMDLNFIVEAVKNDLEAIIKKKQAVISTVGRLEVEVIPLQFQQLFQQLIDNALKFSNLDHPPTVTIKGEIATGRALNANVLLGQNKLVDEQNYCHIAVMDDGIGFSPVYQDRIFELFQRLHDKDTFPGTGIGLSIVKKIVKNHRGVITATGQPGKGARFDIFIPA